MRIVAAIVLALGCATLTACTSTPSLSPTTIKMPPLQGPDLSVASRLSTSCADLVGKPVTTALSFVGEPGAIESARLTCAPASRTPSNAIGFSARYTCPDPDSFIYVWFDRRATGAVFGALDRGTVRRISGWNPEHPRRNINQMFALVGCSDVRITG